MHQSLCAEPEPFPQAWYRRPTQEVARDLLGALFVRNTPQGVLSGIIVEVEAYHGEQDLASHAHRGPTARNRAMFQPGGCLYVYFIYGMHFCMNVVTEGEGVGAAVLLRGIQPYDGLDIMRRNRGAHVAYRQLSNGPAKCCQAFDVGRIHDGASLAGPEFCIMSGEQVPENRVMRSNRIGITRSPELPWRFSIKDNPFVSRRVR